MAKASVRRLVLTAARRVSVLNLTLRYGLPCAWNQRLGDRVMVDLSRLSLKIYSECDEGY